MHWKLKVRKWAENRVHLVTLIAFYENSKEQCIWLKENLDSQKLLSHNPTGCWAQWLGWGDENGTGEERTVRCEQLGAPLGARPMAFLVGWAWWWSAHGPGHSPLPWPRSQCTQYIPPTPDSFRPHNYRTIFTRLDSASLRLYRHTISICVFAVSVAGQLIWPWSTWFHCDNRESLPPAVCLCHTTRIHRVTPEGGREVSKYIIHVTERLPLWAALSAGTRGVWSSWI